MAGSFPALNEVFQTRYRILSLINRGGFGRVYRATQIELNRDVAIKVLQPIKREGMDANEEARRLAIVAKRFEREAQLVSQLRDNHTVMMHDYGTTEDGLLYMVLEYVDGDPLSKVIEDQGALRPSRIVKIARQVLSSLEEAHALNMLHRDVKPQNIMLFDHAGRTDQVKVLDFGLAKSVESGDFRAEDPDLTGEEVILGTPRYMSPEQIRGESLTPSTDIYSLGLVLFEMLTGYKAVEGDSTMNTLARHLNDQPIVLPEELDIPDALRETVNRMLLKDRGARIATATEAMIALETWNGELGRSRRNSMIEDSFDTEAELIGPFDERKKQMLIYAGAAIMALFLIIGVISAFSKDDGSATAAASTSPAVEETASADETKETPEIGEVEAVAARGTATDEPVDDRKPAHDPKLQTPPPADDELQDTVKADSDAEPDSAEIAEEAASDELMFAEPDAEGAETEPTGEEAGVVVAEPEPREPKAAPIEKRPSTGSSSTKSTKKSTKALKSGKKGGGIGLDIRTLD